MLGQLRSNNVNEALQCCAPKPDERWARDQKEDMKTALDLLWKFKEGLDKLHPECVTLIERMLFVPHNRY
jgi:hypothetical protein